MTTYRVFDWNRARKDFATFFIDFFTYNTADWILTTTEAGAGAATEAIGALPGGILVITNDNADNDLDAFQWAGGTGAAVTPYLHTVGKKLQFVSRFKLSDVLNSDFMIGLYSVDTDPIPAVANGIYFRKVEDSARLTMVLENTTVETILDTGIDLVNDTYVDVEFYYDGSKAKYDCYVNGLHAGSVKLTTSTIAPALALALGFVFQNGNAVANVAYIDYVGVSSER